MEQTNILSDFNAEIKQNSELDNQNANESDKNVELNKKIEKFKSYKKKITRVEKLSSEKQTLEIKLDKVNNKLAELLKEV